MEQNLNKLMVSINLILINLFNFNTTDLDKFNSKLVSMNKNLTKLKDDINLILFNIFNFGIDKLKLFNSNLNNLGISK